MHCRTCGGHQVRQFLDLGDQPHCDSLLRPEDLAKPEPCYPLQLCFCVDCTTVQINYTVPKEVMFGEYLYVSGTTKTLRDHFKASAQRLIARASLKKGDLVVDIGSNDGTWLSYFAEAGMRVLGVDGAKNLAELANFRGVETLNRFFNSDVAREIIQTNGRPRLVTAAGVFFHLEELHSVTKGIAELCSDGGLFCVQAIYLGEILRHTQFDQVYHEHLTYWSVTSLDRLLSQHGLEIIHASLIPIHGGSLELLVSKTGTREIDASVLHFKTEEKRLGFDQLETYQGFADRVWKIKQELLRILDDLKSNGKRIYALSAPAKGATLLNSFGISTQYLDCATEVNPLKCGKYIPGARIPIVDERAVEPPDAYLVLAWNFLPEFVRKFKDYILQGGVFVVPIPYPHKISADNISEFL